LNIHDHAERYAPYVLSIVRIVAALLFLEHRTSRLFGWPSPLPSPALFSMYWFAGAIELVGGILLALGLFTRCAAFVMSGEMAFAYFISHAPNSFPDPQPRRCLDPLLLHLSLHRVRRRRALEPRYLAPRPARRTAGRLTQPLRAARELGRMATAVRLAGVTPCPRVCARQLV
jgi:putative oxidoreductase